MPFAPLAALGALVFAFVNFLKYLTNRLWKPALTQLVVWVGGWVAVVLAAHTDYADSIHLGDHRLDQLNGWSLLFLGLVAASIGVFGNEVRKAIDNSESSAKPPLLR